MGCGQLPCHSRGQGCAQGISSCPVALPVQAYVSKVPWSPGQNPAVSEVPGHHSLHEGIVTVEGCWEKVQHNV